MSILEHEAFQPKRPYVSRKNRIWAFIAALVVLASFYNGVLDLVHRGKYFDGVIWALSTIVAWRFMMLIDPPVPPRSDMEAFMLQLNPTRKPSQEE